MIDKISDIKKFIPENFLKDAIFTGNGKQGTVFCYDSMSNFHRGGICEKNERLILHICIMEDVYWRKEKYPIWENIKNF